MAKKGIPKTVETIKHEADKRKNIPTAEYQAIIKNEEKQPIEIRYLRNIDLDPQLVWRGKDEQDWSDLVVQAPPLYIQEKVHPKVLVDDLLIQTKESKPKEGVFQTEMFADFNGIAEGADKTEFYQHDQNWTNRIILGDSLHVMASLSERESLRSQVQCIYFDPPYGIKFNSNFQWSTTDRAAKSEGKEYITREPEQVKAFRDTWRDGIHSYLSYLRDRLTVARDLLTESGAIFVQIGDENVHYIRSIMDEIFGSGNFIAMISFEKTSGTSSNYIGTINDYIIWYAKNSEKLKYRQLYKSKQVGEEGATQYVWLEENGLERRLTRDEISNPNTINSNGKVFAADNCTSMGKANQPQPFLYLGMTYYPSQNAHWKPVYPSGMERLAATNRLKAIGNSLMYKRYLYDLPVNPIANIWNDTKMTGFTESKIYVVQTSMQAIQRCILMTTDPGDLVLDPTCGSGTTAYIAEQWGRRWITIDTSRVALALARARIMGARYPYYLLADSKDGQIKEAEVTRTAPSIQSTHNNIRLGFVYERVPHITLKSIANNIEIDVIWEKYQNILEPLRQQINKSLNQKWEEWEIPCEVNSSWNSTVKNFHEEWWRNRIARQNEMDKSIAAKAEFEYLYDKPYEDKKKVRVAGPFTVESLSPHRMLGVDENDELIDVVSEAKLGYTRKKDFAQIILENLKIAGVQQAHKDDKINFTSLVPWPGDMVCAEGKYLEGATERRAAIFIGPEFGTVQRADLVEAAREAADANFDALIACAFNFEAHTTEFNKLGRIPVLKARMNADLHMADDLKNTGKGNLFVIFGEPDIKLIEEKENRFRIKVLGVDVFKPQTGEIISDNADGIACWFIDTEYNEESFFVRHAYFLGANDPYKSLKTTLKAEIDKDAWDTLYSDISRPFDKPKNGRIAVKVINHLGDEVMKVFKA